MIDEEEETAGVRSADFGYIGHGEGGLVERWHALEASGSVTLRGPVGDLNTVNYIFTRKLSVKPAYVCA